MAGLQSDLLIDRRRLVRRLRVWQVAAVLALLAIVLLAIDRLGVGDGGRYIARVVVDGIILDDLDRTQALRRLAEDDQVDALIVWIDSPGGTVVGGQALYGQLRAVAAEKPVVAVLRELATSAAYMAALGADRIVAREGSITGSIGVIVQTTDVTGLLNDIGVKTEAIKTAPLKAQPNPLEPLTPAARQAVKSVIEDVYDMFVALVAERRALQLEDVKEVADGRVFTGGQAIRLGLVDELGGEARARQWLVEERAVDPDLEVRSVEYGEGPSVAELILGPVEKTLVPERLRLDGLISLWHP